MFWAIISPIFRSTRLCLTACGTPLPGYWSSSSRGTLLPGYWLATLWVHYTTSCNTQSSAPEDGRSNRPKHDELTGIINKLLLLHLVGCLYYLYQ